MVDYLASISKIVIHLAVKIHLEADILVQSLIIVTSLKV